jgi:3-deoxy-D-manno-octulosonic acid kinase
VILPPGYERIDVSGVSAFVWSPAREPVERAIREHGTLRDWAASRPDRDALEGRGTVLAIDAPLPGPDGRPRWAVRHYLRGGAVAGLMGDRYTKTSRPRPRRELQASCAVRRRGVATPAVVAGSTYRAGPFHYRADLITELVPGAVDLAAALFGEERRAGRPDPSEALRAAGVLLGRTAAAGIRHPDLNAKNIVLETGTSPLLAHLIDLDRCRVRRSVRASDERAMSARLHRSLLKHADRLGTALPDLLPLEDGIEEGRATPREPAPRRPGPAGGAP